MLGVLCFTADAGVDLVFSSGVPCMPVFMQRLDDKAAVCEVWYGSGSITQGVSGTVRYRHDGTSLFGVITLTESAFFAHDGVSPLQQATERAYREMFALVYQLGFGHIFRFWNFLPDINGRNSELERYRQFNLGRQAAFTISGGNANASVPAACALGSSRGPLSIAFLAGRVAPRCIENPRQVSAYHYPQQYGPRSPLFSRATLVNLQGHELLFVSGTASVVGHATVHPGDVASQVRETLANLKCVLAEANRLASGAQFDLSNLSCRVYVRRPADLPQIRAELGRWGGGAINAAYLQADICREDLLLEIEGSAAVSPRAACGGRC